MTRPCDTEPPAGKGRDAAYMTLAESTEFLNRLGWNESAASPGVQGIPPPKPYATCPPTGFAAPQPERPTAEEILETARDLISGDRQRTHGDRAASCKNIAELWSAFLGVWIPPYKVALMMALLKIARTKTGELNMDNFVDTPGWSAIAGELAAKGGVEIK